MADDNVETALCLELNIFLLKGQKYKMSHSKVSKKLIKSQYKEFWIITKENWFY